MDLIEYLYKLSKIKHMAKVAREYRNNIILCTMKGHICCIKYGVIYDTFDPSNRITEDAWIVK